MFIKVRTFIVRLVEKTFNLEITRKQFPRDMGPDFEAIYRKCAPFSMVSVERMHALVQAVKYIVKSGIPGAFVECGVWKGGSSMGMAYTLMEEGRADRKIYMYDTYKGMVKPSERDREIETNAPAMDEWAKRQKDDHNEWAYCPLDEVRRNLESTGYPGQNLVFVEGRVEDTIPRTIPGAIALLRLDTDWFESTYHELRHLFPLVADGGVLIIDDYGHYSGSKEAADKYFSENKIPLLLNRIDYSGRLGIKWRPRN